MFFCATTPCSRFFELYHATRESFLYLRQVLRCAVPRYLPRCAALCYAAVHQGGAARKPGGCASL